MSIAVPGTSFHAEIGQLIKYSPHNNSQTESLKQNPNAFVTFQCSIKWADILWWAWHIKRKSVRFSGPAPPTNTWWTSLDAHYLQTSSMHPKKEKKLESGSTFLWPGNCLNNEIALKCREPSPGHMQMSTCEYLIISTCGIRACHCSKMAEKKSWLLIDAIPHIVLQETALTKKIPATTV